jgi:prepilin-type N-terminal cleavage/methylation domain-containing protein
MRQKNPGFTIIELMITVALLGILSGAVAGKFGDIMEKTKEGGTKGNLGTIMAAISVYYGDSNGLFPDNITAQTFQTYLARIPRVTVTHPKTGFHLSGTANTIMTAYTTRNVTIGTDTDGWKYNSKTGDVWVNNSQTDTLGRVYSMYGYE